MKEGGHTTSQQEPGRRGRGCARSGNNYILPHTLSDTVYQRSLGNSVILSPEESSCLFSSNLRVRKTSNVKKTTTTRLFLLRALFKGEGKVDRTFTCKRLVHRASFRRCLFSFFSVRSRSLGAEKRVSNRSKYTLFLDQQEDEW